MRKIILCLFLLIAISASFCQKQSDKPLLEFCNEMREIRSKVQENETINEMPSEVLSNFNERLSSKTELQILMKPFNNITFSTRITYNNATCYEGSFLMMNSTLEYFSFSVHPEAGTRDNNIYVYMELSNLEKLFTQLRKSAERGESNMLQEIINILKTWASVMKNILTGDLRVKPMTGILKVVEGFTIVVKEDMGSIVSSMNITQEV